jgi:hypothetical protein
MSRHDDDYLWDKSGPPDREVVELERILSPLKYQGSFDPAPLEAAPRATAPRARPRAGTARIVAARWLLAAAVLAAIIVAWRALSPPDAERAAPLARLFPDCQAASSACGPSVEPPRSATPGWAVKALAGEPSVSGAPLSGDGTLDVGQWLETRRGERALVTVADIGTLEVKDESRLRLVKTAEDEHRVELDRGSIRARVDAPPRLFVVETRSAVAVDLGCAYSLEIDSQGRGRLEVSSGWVALETGSHDVVVPFGASAPILPGRGPGVPLFDDASARLRDEVSRYDESLARAADSVLPAELLGAARRRDSLTLWHLLWRATPGDRGRLFARLVALGAPRPADVDREQVMAGDRATLMRWREALWESWASEPTPAPPAPVWAPDPSGAPVWAPPSSSTPGDIWAPGDHKGDDTRGGTTGGDEGRKKHPRKDDGGARNKGGSRN